MADESAAWPTEIRLNDDKNRLTVTFDDGKAFELPAEYLRVMSPSAEVQGHSPDQRQTVPGKQNVRVTAIEPVGRYAVRIKFDDGHDTGLYSWSYLHELGSHHDDWWQQYLDEIEEKGMSRA